MGSIPGVSGRWDASPARGVTRLWERTLQCACVSHDKLRTRPRRVAGRAPGMGHCLYIFAVLQTLCREFMSLLTQVHRMKWGECPSRAQRPWVCQQV